MQIKISLGDWINGKTGETIISVPAEFRNWSRDSRAAFVEKRVGRWRGWTEIAGEKSEEI